MPLARFVVVGCCGGGGKVEYSDIVILVCVVASHLIGSILVQNIITSVEYIVPMPVRM